MIDDYFSRLGDACSKGRFTLCPEVKKLSISTNMIARNQEFDLSTLHTRGQSSKAAVLQNACFLGPLLLLLLLLFIKDI
jgi:hypothetical protein